jgi:divalent metal cation (Fe/Co/Zn/Cd) transporter
MPKGTSLENAHRMCDHLEQDIKNKLHQASVTIHVEPCDERCEQCPIPPDLRKDTP